MFTKGTKTLSAQTVARLGSDLREFIDEDEILVFDIMQQPGKLTKSEQRRKLVIVAKKQAKNLERILQFFDTDYPDLKGRRVLIVDDEADLASIRFVRKKDQPDIEQGKIAEQLDALRRLVGKWLISKSPRRRIPSIFSPTIMRARKRKAMFSNRKSRPSRNSCPFMQAMSAATIIFLRPRKTIPGHTFSWRWNVTNKTHYASRINVESARTVF